ncbi:MAG: aldehyde dehydrogenase family protein, partial [Rhizobiaceae bacterium]|nr:aldehyde dehydrogenase family protein [Rhizobiaceae bacterium]
MDGLVAAQTETTPVGPADPAARIATLLAAQKAAWALDVTPSQATRDDRLARLDRMIEAWQDRFAAAISQDFGNRPAVVTELTDVVPVRAAIRHARRHLKRWMRPRRVSLAWTGKPASAIILRQPLGVVGIVAPWNYPLNLMLSPLTGALAAGNRAMLKPSELTPAFSEVLAQAVAETFADAEVVVVTGGPEVAGAFTSAPFDHLIFTGSTAVGRKVAEAAAKNLTPVTLELGGKSPAILDASVQFDKAVPRLVWGKLLNSGQTCVAPDYALVPRGRVADFLTAVKAEVARQYPGLPANADYTSIISPRHYARLTRLVEEAREKGAEV